MNLARQPERTRLDEITDHFNRAKALVEHGIPAPANNHSPPRTVDVWRAQSDSFPEHDLEAIGYNRPVPPPLIHKPWILRPPSLLLLMILCIIMIAALIFSAIYSISHSGFTAYSGTIYGGQYFLFRVLPQLIGALFLIYAQCIIAAVFRVFPFSAMRPMTAANDVTLFSYPYTRSRFYGPNSLVPGTSGYLHLLSG